MALDRGLSLPSRRGFIIAGGLAVLAGVTGCDAQSVTTDDGQPVEPVTPHQVAVGFENHSLGSPITDHVGATMSPAFAGNGRVGCRLEPLRANGNIASLVIGEGFLPNKPWAAFTMGFRLVTLPKPSDSYMNLFEIGNTGTTFPKSQFTAYFKHDVLVCDFNMSEVMQITDMPVLGAWHRISVVVGYGAADSRYRARVQYDDGAPKELVSRANKSPQSVRSVWIHYPTVPVDYTMDVDDIRMVTSSTEPGLFAGP